MASFAGALALAEGVNGGQVTWSRGVDQDAPDFIVTLSEKKVEIELTALTAGALRAERRRLSRVTEKVRDAITAQPDLTAALAGCTVDLSDAATLPMPTGLAATRTATRIATFLAGAASSSALLLRDDVTSVAGVESPEDVGGELGESLDVIDGITIRLVRHGTPGTRFVTHSSQATVTLSEGRRKLSDRLLAKSRKMRENVVVCAGDPDRDGAVLPLDVAEFELLYMFGCGQLPPTPYVKRAWLQLSGSTELIPLILAANSI
jgi:hypothetical protein